MEHFPGLKTQLLTQPLVLYENDDVYEDVRFLHFSMDSEQKLILTAISIFVTGVGFFSNTIVPIVFAFKKKYYKSLSIFFTYINIVNSITLILSSTRFLFHLNDVGGWFVDSLSCRFFPLIRLSLINIPLLITVIIAMEQYYEVRKQFDVSVAFSSNKAIYFCIFSTVIAFICASPIYMFYQHDEYKNTNSSFTTLACLIRPDDVYVEQFYSQFTYFNFTFVVLTPFVIVNYYYLRIILLLSYRKYETTSLKVCEQLYEARPNSFDILWTTAITFFLFLMPVKVFEFWEFLSQNHNLQRLFLFECIVEILSLCYCTLNSVIFFLISSEFRDDLGSLFRCKRSHPSCIKLEMTSF